MSKDPAFLFYSSDFLTGVSDLTIEERGQFITLLCLQHQKGHLSDKVIKIAVGVVSVDVMEKFIKDDEGFYFNERLELEAGKRKAHSEKQKQRALKGWEKRKGIDSPLKATADATALPLEDEDEDEDTIDFNKEGDFDIFWKLYDKKTDKMKCQNEWLNIDAPEYPKILEHVPKFVIASGQYLKNPLKYLEGRLWQDEDLPNYAAKPKAQGLDIDNTKDSDYPSII